MGRFQLEIEIEQPTEVVFDYLADVVNTPQWYSAVRTAEMVDGGGPGLGARYRIERDLPQGRAEDVVTVSEFDRPRAFAFGTPDGRTPFSYRYTFGDHGSSTTLSLDGEIEVRGLPSIADRVATQAFKRGMRDNLEALRRELERR